MTTTGALPKTQARRPSEEAPQGKDHQPPARSLLGICVWIAGQWRPRFWFASIATPLDD